MVSFKRPTGAAADLQELEYISALQQTQEDGVCRADGSICTTDIQLFLKSRYGIMVSCQEVKRTILAGDDVIDLSEMTAMLLIPTLVKAVSSSAQEGIVYPKPNLVQKVLDMILFDVTGSSSGPPPKLSISLLRDMLLVYGEEEMSQDEDLLQEMFKVAAADQQEEGDLLFDANAFARALTSDIHLYNVNDEVSLTTNYHDVMKAKENDSTEAKVDEDEDDLELQENGMKHDHAPPAKIQTFWSSPAIDFTAGRYGSKFIVVFLWSGFIMSYLAYIAAIIREYTSYFVDECDDKPNRYFGCRIMIAIIEWSFILSTLLAFGLGYVALCSTGNGIEEKNRWTRLIALVTISGFTWGFFFAMYRSSDRAVGTVYYTDEDGNVVDEEQVVQEKSESYEAVVHFLALIIGNILILLTLFMMFGESVRKRYLTRASERVIRLFTASGIKGEAANKRAASVKMNGLVDNARQIHSFASKDMDRGETSFGAGLLSFSVRGEQLEEVGGFLWTWKRIWSRELFENDGISISARVLAGNFSQLLITAFVITYGIAFTRRVVDEWERGRYEPAEYLYIALEWLNVLVSIQKFSNSTCDFLLNFTTGVLSESELSFLTASNSTCATIANEAINNAIIGVSESLYPQERYMVEVPMILGTILATLSTLALVTVYIPSVASTTLQFRAGSIPFFRDEYNFELYRTKLDRVAILLGSMFWSSLYAAALVGALAAVAVFLLLWQATRTIFFDLLAIVIALVSTLTIKVLCSIYLLRKAYAAFYRKRVNQANIMSLAIECIMVGFAIATALARAAKIIVISALYIGRLDVPLLASGVGIGALEDRYPHIFRQDILALEAHRHPYIDLIGKLYLLKLRHGGRFVSRAGYCYRLIFTVALLPWLRKYRVLARPEGTPEEKLRRASILPGRSSSCVVSAQDASAAVTMQNENGNELSEHDHESAHTSRPSPHQPVVSGVMATDGPVTSQMIVKDKKPKKKKKKKRTSKASSKAPRSDRLQGDTSASLLGYVQTSNDEAEEEEQNRSEGGSAETSHAQTHLSNAL